MYILLNTTILLKLVNKYIGKLSTYKRILYTRAT